MLKGQGDLVGKTSQKCLPPTDDSMLPPPCRRLGLLHTSHYQIVVKTRMFVISFIYFRIYILLTIDNILIMINN